VDTRPWPEKLEGKGWSLLTYVLFELPSGYGLTLVRPLVILLVLILLFAGPYWIAVKYANYRHGLWAVVPADRLAKSRGKERIMLLRPHPARTWRARVRCELWTLRTSLCFSLLSAFHTKTGARYELACSKPVHVGARLVFGTHHCTIGSRLFPYLYHHESSILC
jgi:hypothetical protein